MLSNVGSRQKVPFIEKCFCVFNKIQNFYKYGNTMNLNDDPKRRKKENFSEDQKIFEPS